MWVWSQYGLPCCVGLGAFFPTNAVLNWIKSVVWFILSKNSVLSGTKVNLTVTWPAILFQHGNNHSTPRIRAPPCWNPEAFPTFSNHVFNHLFGNDRPTQTVYEATLFSLKINVLTTFDQQTMISQSACADKTDEEHHTFGHHFVL